MTKFDEFKSKEKFLQDDKLFYSGIGDPNLKLVLIEKINLAADDFKNLADKGNATDKVVTNTNKIKTSANKQFGKMAGSVLG